MPDLIVSGNLSQISASLRRLSEVIKNREALGWTFLHHDEEWMYISARDEKVCDGQCLPLEHTIHRGDDIPRKFPFYEIIDNTHVYANRHPHCRCILEWENVSETLEKRLHREKLMVI